MLTSRAVCWLQTTVVSSLVSIPLVFRESRIKQIKLASDSPADQQLYVSAAGYHKAPNTGNKSYFSVTIAALNCFSSCFRKCLSV